MECGKNNDGIAQKQESSHAYGIAPIAALFRDCLQRFERLCSTIESREITGNSMDLMRDGCFSKFCTWGSDTGAPTGSLDHALRKSSRLQQTTKNLLDDLVLALQTTRCNLPGADVPPKSPGSQDFNAQIDGVDPILSSRASSDSETSLQQSADDIEEIVNCLNKLVPALQDPAPQDIYNRQASQNEANNDIELVAKLFPRAAPSLTRRLGFSNWKRRQSFRKLKRQNSDDPNNDEYKHEFSSISEIMKSDYRAAFSSHRISTGQSDTDVGSSSVDDSIFTRPNFSTGRTVSSVSDTDYFGSNQYEIPKPPVVLGSSSAFDCPYCGQEILFGVQITSEDDWAHHIFMDLEPYQCTFDDCIRADKTFGIREDWFQHELDNHRLHKVWVCQSCADEFDQTELFESHLSEKHKTTVEPSHLPIMASLCQRYSEKTISNQACPFCGISNMKSQALEEHVAKHMEQLALMVIQSEVGLEKDASSMNAIRRYKLDLIVDFVRKQRDDCFKQPVQEQAEYGTEDPASVFADDSEDEGIALNLKRPTVEAEVPVRSSRPPLRRNADSWTRKVHSYLDIQPKSPLERVERDLWPSKVGNFLEDQSERGERGDRPMEGNLVIPVESLGHQHSEETSQETNLVTALPTFRTKPPPRNEDFVGRNDDLSKIHRVLSPPGSICVLSGTAGMGKTSTAIEYTYRYEDSYSHIFWITAESAISCADSYSLIATHLVVAEDDIGYEQARLITLGREFLEQAEMRWLIVFDNVSIWSDISDYLPTDPFKTHGSILITAGVSDLKFLAPLKCQFMELGALTLEESRQLLLLSMQPSLTPQQLRSHPEHKLAGEIAILAERLPLALALIAGFLQVSKCTLTDFVQLWNEKRRHTKSLAPVNSPRILPTDRALETVWNIGLREVTIDARELLNILAFLDSETIQRKLLVGEHKEPSLDFLHSDQTFRFKRMITELSCRRLIAIKTQDGEEFLSIHRSLQEKILHDLDRDAQKREDVFGQAFDLVRKRFPLPSPIQVPEPEKWPDCKENLPHVLHLQKVVIETLPSMVPSVKVARLLSDGGINLWERGMTSEGLRLLRSAEAILDKIDYDEKQLKANIHIIIALLIQDYGFTHFAESKNRIWEALRIRKDYKSQTNPNLYTRDQDILLHNAWSDYGCVLLQYNDYKEAEPIFRTCFGKYHEWGDESEIPYEYYKFNHHTAFCRLYHHDFAGAIRLAEEGLRMITLATGQSSATSKTRFDLACIVMQSGDFPRALSLHQEVLESNLKQHGKFSFLTLQSYYAVGALHAYCGDLAEAERLMAKALSLERSRKGSWPEAAVARTEFHLSQILSQQGKDLDEAQQLASQARTVLVRLLPLHPLDGVEEGDELALFDHLQPVFDGRFTGRALLKYVSDSL